jgi:hypothetical protein
MDHPVRRHANNRVCLADHFDDMFYSLLLPIHFDKMNARIAARLDTMIYILLLVSHLAKIPGPMVYCYRNMLYAHGQPCPYYNEIYPHR